MLSFTAGVLLTITAATVTPTMTVGETKIYSSLTECAHLAEKMETRAYNKGYNDGAKDQYCLSVCEMQKSNLNALNSATSVRMVTFEAELIKSAYEAIKKNKCKCSEYKKNDK